MDVSAVQYWGELSGDSDTGEEQFFLNLVLTTQEKFWLKLFCLHTGAQQQFFVAQALRFFDHVRTNFEVDHGDARRAGESAGGANLDFVMHRFPYVAPRTPAPDGTTLYHYIDGTGEPRYTPSKDVAEQFGIESEEVVETVRTTTVVPARLVAPVRRWTQRDLHTDSTGYYTGFVLLAAWVKSGQQSLGPYDDFLRVDSDWSAEAY